MRTLAVLAALAAVAIAVPALPGYDLGYRPVQYRLPANYREKKSPQTLIDPAPIEFAIDTSLDATPEVSARTVALKKPIIIKKNVGYHLYRDSDEEQAHADPRERCDQEVKVKLCDAKHLAQSSNNMRAAEESEKTENDMETSIKLAKEAVENLQKMTKFQRTRLGAEDGVHDDIEVARQALEHIQQNFGNLESMNVHAATLSDAEALKNARFTIANTENERMAQWKEAINNIQKNAEIAKNIEDSFKTTNSMNAVVTEDSEAKQSAKSSESDHKDHLESLAQLKASKNADLLHDMTSAASEIKESKLAGNFGNTNVKAEVTKVNDKAVTDEESRKTDAAKVEKKTEMMKQPKAAEHMKVDQAPAASMTSVSFTKDDEARAVHQWTNKAKDSEGEKSALKERPSNKIVAKSSELISEEGNKEMGLSEMKHEKASEVDTTSLMNSSESEAALHKIDELKEKDAEQPMKPAVNKANEHNVVISKTDDGSETKSAIDGPFPPFFKAAENKKEDFHMKSADLSSVNQKLSTNLHISETQLKEQNTEMKSALMEVPVGEEKDAHMKSAFMETSASEHREVFTKGQKIADFSPFDEHAHQMKTANNAPVDDHKPLDDSTIPKAAAEVFQKSDNLEAAPSSQVEAHLPPPFPFKSAEHQEKSAAMKASEPTRMHEQSGFQSQGKNWHMDALNQKTSDMDFERTPIKSHSHIFGSPSGHHFVGAPIHGHIPYHHGPSIGFHHTSKGYGFKAAEADSAVQATSHVNVNDAAGKSALEHSNLMQWKQKEAARGAYGAYGASAGVGAGLSIGAGSAGGASGAGALGVFPGAKVGGCAIPLLLSCSPSVVSGSLAAPSYSAPHAYRSANNFSDKFSMKRDTKKANDISIKVKRTPSKVIQKIPLEKKL